MDEALYWLAIELGANAADTADALSGWLFENGVAGIEEQETDQGLRLCVYGTDRASLGQLAEHCQQWLVTAAAGEGSTVVARFVIAEIESSSWQTEWTRYLEPQPLGTSLVLQPVWDESPPPPGRRSLLLQPRLAFGVGSHPTTQLSAAGVERYCRSHPGCRVLDVGTGTAVLAMVALCSGAESVDATDTDPVAIEAACHNLALNDLSGQCRVHAGSFPPGHAQFDLVVANLEAPILLQLANALAERIAPSGRLMVSGMLESATDAVIQALQAVGLEVAGRHTRDGWSLVELVRP